jgi:hypothetical protein
LCCVKLGYRKLEERRKKPNDVRNASLLLVSLAKKLGFLCDIWRLFLFFFAHGWFCWRRLVLLEAAGSAGGGWVFIVTAMQVASFTFLCVLEN